MPGQRCDAAAPHLSLKLPAGPGPGLPPGRKLWVSGRRESPEGTRAMARTGASVRSNMGPRLLGREGISSHLSRSRGVARGERRALVPGNNTLRLLCSPKYQPHLLTYFYRPNPLPQHFALPCPALPTPTPPHPTPQPCACAAPPRPALRRTSAAGRRRAGSLPLLSPTTACPAWPPCCARWQQPCGSPQSSWGPQPCAGQTTCGRGENLQFSVVGQGSPKKGCLGELRPVLSLGICACLGPGGCTAQGSNSCKQAAPRPQVQGKSCSLERCPAKGLQKSTGKIASDFGHR